MRAWGAIRAWAASLIDGSRSSSRSVGQETITAVDVGIETIDLPRSGPTARTRPTSPASIRGCEAGSVSRAHPRHVKAHEGPRRLIAGGAPSRACLETHY